MLIVKAMITRFILARLKRAKRWGCLQAIKLSTHSLLLRSGNWPLTALQHVKLSRSMVEIYLNLMTLGSVFKKNSQKGGGCQ